MQGWIQPGSSMQMLIQQKRAIDKATYDINPLYSNEYDIEWKDDEELLKRLYCLK